MALPLGRGSSMPSLDDCPQAVPPTPSRAAGLPRNRWLLCVGITGWIQSECPAALRRNAHLTVWFTDEAVAAWAAAPRTTRGGQPFYSPMAILTALTLRAVFRLAYRQAEGLIGSIISLLGLTLRVPDPTTRGRRSATLAVPRPQPNNSVADALRSRCICWWTVPA